MSGWLTVAAEVVGGAALGMIPVLLWVAAMKDD